MWTLMWIVISGVVLIFLAAKWRHWYDNTRRKTPSELFRAIEHDIAIMRTMVEYEFLPLTEDLMATMTDLLREMEAEERRQQ